MNIICPITKHGNAYFMKDNLNDTIVPPKTNKAKHIHL